MKHAMEHAIRVMVILFILVSAHAMTEKDILTLILISVVYIAWYYIDKGD